MTHNTIRSSSSFSPAPLKARIFELSLVCVLLAGSANTPGRAQAEAPVAPSTQSGKLTAQPQSPNAPNAITGIAFRDKNSDGKRDAGEPGVVNIAVTAYGTDGTTRGTATTAGDGSYSLAASGAGPYRVEFTNFPLFMRPGPQGADSGTTAQFVPDGNATNINVNFVNPDDYVGPTVNLATTLFVAGTQTGTKPTLVGHPYAVNSPTGVEQFPIALENQIGTTYGLAYQRSNKTLYAASFVKRGTGFGPGGIGAIYKVPAAGSGSGTPSVFIDIGSAAGSFTKPRDLNPDPPDFDSEAITLTGKAGFGDLDISEDETTLYTVNLANRSLYKIDVLAANAAPGGTAGVTLIGLHPDPNCIDGVARPFALEVKDGVVYVGGMCTGELGPSAGNTETVEAYVYTYTSASGWGSEPVLRFPLAYPTTCADVDAAYDPNKSCNRPGAIGSVADWWSWADHFPLRVSAGITDSYTFNSETEDGFIISPEPILSDIEINGTDMILGIRDRFGDQGGWDDPGPDGIGNSPFSGTVNMRAVPKADILRASPEITQATYANGPEVSVLKWKIEGNASGSTFGPGAHPNDGSGPCNGVQGPNGENCGEFYDDNFNPTPINGHDEVALGSLAQVEGAGEVVTTAYDPFIFESAGTIQLSNVNGSRVRGFQLFEGGSFRTQGDYLNKANGMGDLEVMTEAAPVELGNVVWRDANNNGLQDPGEPGIAGVTVSLFRPGVGADCVAGNADDAQPVAKAVTDAKGEYYFRTGAGADAAPTDSVGLLNGAVCGMTPFATYTLKLDNAPDFTAGQPLGGLLLTEADDAVPSPGGSNRSDSDAVLVGALPVITYTLGGPGSNDHRLDFGFVGTIVTPTVISYSVGNEVWLDANNSAVIDPSELGAAGVTMTLHHDANTNGAIDGGELSPTATMTTNAQGFYLFTVQQAGSYAACVAAANFGAGAVLSGYLSSGESVSVGGTVTETPSASPDGDNDNDDNGTRRSGAGSFCAGGVASALMSVTGNEPSTEVPTNVPATRPGETPGITDTAQNSNSNMTLDFGFYKPVASPKVSLGNLVWIDTNNNSMWDTGEVGVNGVAVELYCDTNNSGGFNAGDSLISSTVTGGGGLYVFGNLTPTGASCSGYIPIITGANFCTGQPLAGFFGSMGSVTGNSDQNNKDHGIADGATTCNQPVVSTPVSVTVGAEPTSDGDADSSSNLTLDFGFYIPASLGNRVWFDENKNGQQDPGETNVPGITVTLRSSAGAVLSTTFTNASGLYTFTNLPPGSYSVCFQLPADRGMTTKGSDGGSDTDSNADPATNCTGQVTLTSGQNNPTLDVGIIIVGPTVVQLTRFATTRASNGIRVVWATGSEINTFGFALYRAERNERNSAVLVTQALIAAKGVSEYVYVDTTAAPDTNYYYWLIETETTGATNEYGPLLTDLGADGTDGVFVLQSNGAVVAGGVATEVRVNATNGVVAEAETTPLNPSAHMQGQSAVQVLAQPVNQAVPEQPARMMPTQKAHGVTTDAAGGKALDASTNANAPGAATIQEPVAPAAKREAASSVASVLDTPAIERQVGVVVNGGGTETKPVAMQPRTLPGWVWVGLGIAMAGAILMMSLGAGWVFVARRRKA